MAYEFTPAAERAIAVAANWRPRADLPIDAPEMLLGLLREPECRAAMMLARHGVDAATVQSRWPDLAWADRREDEPRRFSQVVLAALDFAEDRLFEHPRPLELATEHVLLGLIGGGGEVSLWLQQRGLDPATIEAEVHRLAGHTPGPLDWDDGDTASVPNSARESRVAGAERGVPQEEHGSVGLSVGSLRLADAAANRAGEGLRVVEDYVRFVLDDRHLTQRIKVLRHDLAQALAIFPVEQRHSARETQGDVGTDISTAGEQNRLNLEAIVTTSFKRVQQSLRSLEEIAKLTDAAVAARFERLRYESYTLEKAVDVTRTSIERLASARLYVLFDGRSSEAEFRRLVSTLVTAGVDIVQLRDKQLGDRELVARARLARALTRDTATLLIINDRPDIAALSQADGVHVGQDELSVKDARAIVGPRALIGVSTHSIEQARKAVLDGANYIGVGPTFPSETKQFVNFPGLELLRQVAGEISLPAFAIGGISEGNLSDVLSTGIKRVAVSAAVTRATKPREAAKKIRAMLS